MNMLFLCLIVPCVGMQCVIVIFPGHTNLRFSRIGRFCNGKRGRSCQRILSRNSSKTVSNAVSHEL